jgi:hypothetical protein
VTIEEIIELPIEKLKAMTDEELLQHFKQYLDVTRPELAIRPKTMLDKPMQQVYADPKKKAALAALADSGIDLSFMRKKFKR